MDLNLILLKVIKLLNLENYEDKILGLIDFKSLLLILIYITIVGIITAYSLYLTIKNKGKYEENIINFQKEQISVINKIFEHKIYLLFIIPFFLTFYLALYLPVTYDETFTFVNFINRGIAVSASFYPAPNNHVLYSVIGSFLNLFNFKNIFPFRVISIVFFILSLYMITKILILNSKKIKNYYFLLIAVFPLTLVYIYQSSLARGYSLLIFLTLINIYLIKKIIKNDDNKNLLKFSLFSALSFYTIPSYFYTHLIFCIILLWKKNFINFLIKSNIIILFLTIIFYFPIIIFQGFDFIFQNNLIEKINYNEFSLFINRTKFILENEIFGTSIFFILILLFVSFYFYIRIKKVKFFFILLSIIMLTIFLPYLTKSIAPGRTLQLIYILTPIIIFFPLKQFFEKLNKKNLIIICLLTQIILSINIFMNMPQEKYSLKAEEYSKKILINDGTYFSCSSIFDPLFLYYIIKNEAEIHSIELSENLKCDSKDSKKYDWVIIDKIRDESSRKPDFQSLTWNFYKN